MVDDAVGGCFGGRRCGVKVNLDILGWFVGRVHTSQVDELATSSLGIRALSVAGCPRPTRVESVIGLVKAECIHTTVFHARVYRGLADIEWATADWVDWYNNRRLHSSLDCLTPEEFEQALYAAIGREPQSAWERHRTCGASPARFLGMACIRQQSLHAIGSGPLSDVSRDSVVEGVLSGGVRRRDISGYAGSGVSAPRPQSGPKPGLADDVPRAASTRLIGSNKSRAGSGR